MVPFAGFEMPLEYTGVRQEHRNVRENVGVFDVSHMGEIWVRGPEAFGLVQRLTSNDIGLLSPGRIQYSCFPNESGGIVDDLLVYHFTKEAYLLVVNASNVEKDFRWILEHNDRGSAVEDDSAQLSQLAIQGPRAAELLQDLTRIDLSKIPYYHFTKGELAGVKDVIISNSGYTGAGGFELYILNEQAPRVWERLFEHGQKLRLAPSGLASRDTLRLEMGFCLYGNDIDDTTSPIEAGLGWITKFVEGNDFINRRAFEIEKSGGVHRKLVGFEMKERAIPRQHYPILDGEGNPLGEVTSGTMSPMTGIGIGMGYVRTDRAATGSEIFIGIRNKMVPAVVVRPPFYKPNVSTR
jgi:aminomethyltransferase